MLDLLNSIISAFPQPWNQFNHRKIIALLQVIAAALVPVGLRPSVLIAVFIAVRSTDEPPSK